MSTVPPKQRRIGVSQSSSHRPLSDSVQVSTQDTHCENSEGDGDDSGVGYEDEINSSDEEGQEQVSLGTSKMLLDDNLSEIYSDQAYHGLHNDANDANPKNIIYRANDTSDSDSDGDHAFQGFNARVYNINHGSRDPLLGKFSINKCLRSLAYHCRIWL